MNEVLVFYAGQVHWQFERYNQFIRHRKDSLIDSEIYNGAYTYFRKPFGDFHWFRIDGTPCPLEDVPKDIQAWVLLMS